jgi:lipoprotein-anchoring transpeptidase ErfK/SrfK
MQHGLEPRWRAVVRGTIVAAPLACSVSCDRETATSAAPSATRQPAAAPSTTDPRSEPVRAPARRAAILRDGADAGGGDGGPDAPVSAGPYFTVTSGSTGVYAEPSPDRSLKLGYARSGGRVPVLPGTLAGDGCRAGWYRLVDGGFICASDGSVDATDPRVRLAVRPPDLSAILPYPYARNAQNGTPLYTSVPSQDQIALYEPSAARSDATRAPVDPGSVAWWQRKEAALSEVRLAELALESDGVLGRRMVKGFYIAIDTEFEWSSRRWYKTTKGMIAPKERFVAVEGSPFEGARLDEEHTLPVAWAYGSKENRPTYTIDSGKATPNGVVDKLKAVYLNGESIEAEGRRYVQSTSGFWLRSDQVRIAQLPPIPVSVTPEEHWIHVDLRSQTLVALVGSTPVFATLISSGKESEQQDEDHRTPPGEWNIREKHISTTMDGDGTAAGDLPYSIEDVPYVMYFHGSYALHAAFWHRNYGVRMSHGCINLAPLDAKYLFLFTGPTVREGWHGAWAGNGQAGSRIVIDGPVREPTARR